MKKLIFLCFCLSLSNLNKAQVPDTAPWCPDGATWVYNKIFPNQAFFSVYEYQKDTIINSFLTKVIRAKEIELVFPNPMNPSLLRGVHDSSYFYLRESNDSIYYLVNGVFRFMYNFNASIGDEFISTAFNDYYSCSTPVADFYDDDTLKCINIDYPVSSNNLTFKRLKMSSSGRWEYGDIINKIGGFRSFVPRSTQDTICYWDVNYSPNGMVCYSDNIRGTLTFQNQSDGFFEKCEYITTKVNPIELVLEDYFIYPNPTNDKISIFSLNSNIYSDYYIVDLFGRKLMSCFNSNLQNIDTSKLPKGNYLLILNPNKSQQKTLKFIKL
jgi:hypothetical protein